MARRSLVLASWTALSVTAVLTAGCGGKAQIAAPVTTSTQQSEAPSTIPAVAPPDPNVGHQPAVAAAQASVVRVHGVAHSCRKRLEGTGFVVAPKRVMTTAHGVAGTDAVSVEVDGTKYDGQVVSFDPNLDISILAVPDLPTAPLMFSEAPAVSGADAAALGFPHGGPYEAKPVRVREVIKLQGPDIFRTGTVTREVYALRGAVQQGNSGGPVVDLDGRVRGVVFGAAQDDPDTSFALTAKEVAPQLALVGNTQPVPTAQCVLG
ncbi:MarP family serine protease [Mycolicibacterium sp. CBMA 226]|uniref:MarP family serine protease n=1 Tax=Mycolicibacterium sp. CBMA 226 TaxID=2606611 RepID=UPI0012DD83D2|nr:MarP family serine protease [Mycolicibacterium sp. CBMA 226]MUL74821.1 MarP family serine protease [Mycolicibacterium sp. CBMA 226]